MGASRTKLNLALNLLCAASLWESELEWSNSRAISSNISTGEREHIPCPLDQRHTNSQTLPVAMRTPATLVTRQLFFSSLFFSTGNNFNKFAWSDAYCEPIVYFLFHQKRRKVRTKWVLGQFRSDRFYQQFCPIIVVVSLSKVHKKVNERNGQILAKCVDDEAYWRRHTHTILWSIQGSF